MSRMNRYVAWDGGSWTDGTLWLLRQRIRSSRDEERIDGIIAVLLAYVLWFGLMPLFRLI